MNTTRDIENAILLRESGELSPDGEADLEAALAERPGLRDFAESSQILQRAGRDASRLTVPEVTELQRELILTRTRGHGGRLPRLLALAALLVLALGVWPHLSGLLQSKPRTLNAEVEPIRQTLAEADPLIGELDELDRELERLAETDAESIDFIVDSDYWAGELLALEDTI